MRTVDRPARYETEGGYGYRCNDCGFWMFVVWIDPIGVSPRLIHLCVIDGVTHWRDYTLALPVVMGYAVPSGHSGPTTEEQP